MCFFTRHCLSPKRTTYLGSARTWNTNMQALCLVACERPVVPPCGSKFVFQRVTARLCCFSSLRWKCANICRVDSFPTPFSRARVVCGFCNIVTYLCLGRCWMFTVDVTRHLNAMGLCFCVHMQVVFISRLLASWAFVWFLSNIVVAFSVFREFDRGLCGCHGTI